MVDMQIDSELIKSLRSERGWSQEQLATVAGLSLRTVQRIENEGVCSLESRRALAAAFEEDVSALEASAEQDRGVQRGVRYGFLGAALGVTGAAIGIAFNVIEDGASWREIGLSIGLLGAAAGIVGAFIGISARRMGSRQGKAG